MPYALYKPSDPANVLLHVIVAAMQDGDGGMSVGRCKDLAKAEAPDLYTKRRFGTAISRGLRADWLVLLAPGSGMVLSETGKKVVVWRKA